MTYLEQLINKTIIDVEVTTSESIAFVTSLEVKNIENIDLTREDKTRIVLAVRLYFGE